MDVHVLKALAYICYLATLLPDSSSVDDNLKKGIETYFIYLLYNNATLYDIEHSSVFQRIPAHCMALVFFLARDWERHAPLIELRK